MSDDATKSFEVRALEVYDALVACRLERDVALAENQRLLPLTRDNKALVAENQRLREALQGLVAWSATVAAEEGSEVHALFAFAREALAGDTE